MHLHQLNLRGGGNVYNYEVSTLEGLAKQGDFFPRIHESSDETTLGDEKFTKIKNGTQTVYYGQLGVIENNVYSADPKAIYKITFRTEGDSDEASLPYLAGLKGVDINSGGNPRRKLIQQWHARADREADDTDKFKFKLAGNKYYTIDQHKAYVQNNNNDHNSIYKEGENEAYGYSQYFNKPLDPNVKGVLTSGDRTYASLFNIDLPSYGNYYNQDNRYLEHEGEGKFQANNKGQNFKLYKLGSNSELSKRALTLDAISTPGVHSYKYIRTFNDGSSDSDIFYFVTKPKTPKIDTDLSNQGEGVAKIIASGGTKGFDLVLYKKEPNGNLTEITRKEANAEGKATFDVPNLKLGQYIVKTVLDKNINYKDRNNIEQHSLVSDESDVKETKKFIVGQTSDVEKQRDIRRIIPLIPGTDYIGKSLEFTAKGKYNITGFTATGANELNLKWGGATGTGTQESKIRATGTTPRDKGGAFPVTLTVTSTVPGTNKSISENHDVVFIAPPKTGNFETSNDDLRTKATQKPTIKVKDLDKNLMNPTIPSTNKIAEPDLEWKAFLVKNGRNNDDDPHRLFTFAKTGYEIVASTTIKSDGTATFDSNTYKKESIGTDELRVIAALVKKGTDEVYDGTLSPVSNSTIRATNNTFAVKPEVSANSTGDVVTRIGQGGATAAVISYITANGALQNTVLSRNNNTWTLPIPDQNIRITTANDGIASVTIPFGTAQEGTKVSARQKDSTSELSEPGEAYVPTDAQAPVVKIRTGQNVESLPERRPDDSEPGIYSVAQGERFAPNLEVVDNRGKVTEFTIGGGNLPDNVSLTPFVRGDNFHENTPYRPGFSGSVPETFKPGNYTRTITVKDGNNNIKTYYFKYQILPKAPTVTTDQAYEGNLSSSTRRLSGTGIQGATVKITLQDGSSPREVRVGRDGTWTYDLKEGEVLTQNQQTSAATKATTPVSVKQVVNGAESEPNNVGVKVGLPRVENPLQAGRDVTFYVSHDTKIFYIRVAGVEYGIEKSADNWQIIDADKRSTTELNVEPSTNPAETKLTLHVKDTNVKTNIPYNIPAPKQNETNPNNAPSRVLLRAHYDNGGKNPAGSWVFATDATNTAPTINVNEPNKNDYTADGTLTKDKLKTLVNVIDAEDDNNKTVGNSAKENLDVTVTKNGQSVDLTTGKALKQGTYNLTYTTTDAAGESVTKEHTLKVNYTAQARPTINLVQGETVSDELKRSLVQLRDGNDVIAVPQDAIVDVAVDTSAKSDSKQAQATVVLVDGTRLAPVTIRYKVLSTFPIARMVYDFAGVNHGSSHSEYYTNNGSNVPPGMSWVYKKENETEKPENSFTDTLAKDTVGTTHYTFTGKYNRGRFTDTPIDGERLRHEGDLVHKVFDITENSTKVTVEKGATLNSENAKAAVMKVQGSDDLPQGTTYEWVNESGAKITPTVSTAGIQSLKVKVTLPKSQDGNNAPVATQKQPSKIIDVTVNVKPTAPEVVAKADGGVTISNTNETNVNKIQVTYTPSPTIATLTETDQDTFVEHPATQLTAIKNDQNKWSITEGKKDGISIDEASGAITINDATVKDGSPVVAKAITSDNVESAENRATTQDGDKTNPTVGLGNTLVPAGKQITLNLNVSDSGVGVDNSKVEVKNLPAGLQYNSANQTITGSIATASKTYIKVLVRDKKGNKTVKTVSLVAVQPKPIYAIKDDTIKNVATASKFVEVPTGLTSPSVAWKDGQPTTATAGETHKTVTVSADGYTSTEVDVPVTVYPKVTYRKVGGKEVTEYDEIVGQPLTSSVSGTGGRTKEATADFYVEFEGGNKPNGTTVVFKNGTPTSTTAGTSSQTIVVTYPNEAGTIEKRVTFKTYGNEAKYETGKDFAETTVGSEFAKIKASDFVKPSSTLANPDRTFISWWNKNTKKSYNPENKIGKREENVNVYYGDSVRRARGDETYNYNDQDITVTLAVKPQAPTIATDAFHGKGATRPAVTVSNIPTANQLEGNARVTVELYQGGNKVASKELSSDEITRGAGSVRFDTANYTSNLTLGEKVHAVVRVEGGSGTTAYNLSSADSNDVQVTPQKPTFDSAVVTSTSRTLRGTLGGFDDTNRVVELHLNDEANTVLSSARNEVTLTGDKWTANIPKGVKLRASVAKNGETTTPPAITVKNTVTGGTVSTTSDAKEVSMGAYSVSPAIAGSKHIDITVPHDAKRVELRFHNNQETGDKPNGITLVRGADGTWHTDATRADNTTVTDASGYVGRISSSASKTNPAESIITIPLNEESNGKKLHIREEAANRDNTATYGKGLGLRVDYQPEAGQDPTAAGNWKVVSVTNTAPTIKVKGDTGKDATHRKVYESGTTLTADLLKDLVTVTDAEDNATDVNNKPYGSPTIEIVSGLTETPGKATAPGIYTVTLKATDSQGRESNELTVYVEVRKQKDTYAPNGQNQTVNNGDTPKAKDSISNVADLPENTRIEWKETPTTTEKGNHDAVVVVTYPDGTSEEVPVTITVKETNINGVPEVQPVLPEFNGGVNGGPETQEELPKFNGGVNTPDSPIHERPDFAGGVNGELPDPAELPKVQLIITKWIDENGNELKPADAKAPSVPGEANEAYEHGEIEGYVFVRTETKGDVVTHIFRKVSPVRPTSDSQQRPATPSDDTNRRPDTATPAEAPTTQPAEQPSQTVEVPAQLPNEVSETDSSVSQPQAVLPNTGTKADRATGALGVLSLLGAFGLLFAKKKKDDEEEA